MKRKAVTAALLLIVMLLAGCGEKKSEYEIQKEKANREVAQQLSLYRKNNDIAGAIGFLSKKNADNEKIVDISGYDLCISPAFQGWFLDSMTKVVPNYSSGYYDALSNRRENYDKTSYDGIRSVVTYVHFGDFEVECSWEFDTDLKMYTRNICYAFRFRGIWFGQADYERMQDELSVLKQYWKNENPGLYIFGDYVALEEYKEFTLYDKDRSYYWVRQAQNTRGEMTQIVID